MTPTEELCAKLDKLGVEYDTYDLPNGNHGVSWIDGNNIEWEVVPQGDNFEIHALQLVTPEQVIAATVGDRNPDGLPIGLTVSNDGNLLNWVGENYVRQDAVTVGAGTLTAEQVRECLRGVYFEGYSDGATHRVNGIEETDWQAIADKLNATVGNRDTMGLWPEWEQVLFANVSDEVAQDNLNECVHELLDKAATVGVGTCIYTPDETGFTWWDENDVEHYEEHSASDECCSASCDKCGNQMMVGDDGWFNGWDEITEWWEEDGSYHKGYVLEPRFKHCPNCGARVVGA